MKQDEGKILSQDGGIDDQDNYGENTTMNIIQRRVQAVRRYWWLACTNIREKSI